jgi:hypothetical protein
VLLATIRSAGIICWSPVWLAACCVYTSQGRGAIALFGSFQIACCRLCSVSSSSDVGAGIPSHTAGGMPKLPICVTRRVACRSMACGQLHAPAACQQHATVSLAASNHTMWAAATAGGRGAGRAAAVRGRPPTLVLGCHVRNGSRLAAFAACVTVSCVK